MAVLEIPGNGDNGHHISPECIQKALESLDDPLQRDFISCCLVSDPAARPAARDLLFHTVLFEVHSLKLCSAHAFVKYSCIMPESMVEEAYQFKPAPEHVIAEITRADREPSTYIVSQANMLELEKFLEDVKNGVYPLTAFSSVVPGQTSRTRAVSPEISESVKSVSPEPVDSEIRLINSMTCQVRPKSEQDANLLQMTIVLHMDDRMYRQLGCDIVRGEVTPAGLADELVSYGFINIEDREKMTSLIDTEFNEISTRPINGNGSHGSHGSNGSNGSNGDGTIENGPNGNNLPSSALITA